MAARRVADGRKLQGLHPSHWQSRDERDQNQPQYRGGEARRLSKAEFRKRVDSEDSMFRWNGEVIVPKDVVLYQLDEAQLDTQTQLSSIDVTTTRSTAHLVYTLYNSSSPVLNDAQRAELELQLQGIASQLSQPARGECAIALPDEQRSLLIAKVRDSLSEGNPKTTFVIDDLRDLAEYQWVYSSDACQLYDRAMRAADDDQRVRHHLELAVKPSFPSRSEFTQLDVDRFGLTAGAAYDFAAQQLKHVLVPATTHSASDRPVSIPYYATRTTSASATSNGRDRLRVVVRQTLLWPPELVFTETTMASLMTKAQFNTWVKNRRTPSAAFLRQARRAIRKWQSSQCNVIFANRAKLHAQIASQAPPQDTVFFAAAGRELVDRIVARPKNACGDRDALDAMIDYAIATERSLRQPHAPDHLEFTEGGRTELRERSQKLLDRLW